MPLGIFNGYDPLDSSRGRVTPITPHAISLDVASFAEGVLPRPGDTVEWNHLGISHHVEVVQITLRGTEKEDLSHQDPEYRFGRSIEG